MRLLGGLCLVAPVVLISLFITMPSAANSWVDDGVRSVFAAIAAGAVGVSLTAVLVATYSRLRLRQVIRVAERSSSSRPNG
jgi:formate hydrogenlyase subunit 4